jgi:hypothetical protein
MGEDEAMSGTEKNENAAQPDGADGHPSAPEDVREKFRQALEAKNAQKHASAAAGADGGSKASTAHTNSKVQREFRRKSGS